VNTGKTLGFGNCLHYGISGIINMDDNTFANTEIWRRTMTNNRQLIAAVWIEHTNDDANYARTDV
jgi:hypothetical protein